jgi:copper homeostasis protein
VHTKRGTLVEACVDSVESALAAEAGGAGRIELCDNLVEGGTTPSIGAITLARDALHVPIHVIVRPRGGDFLYSEREVETMRRDIAAIMGAGAAGVVIGALRADGTVDIETTARLIAEARPLSVTFHRAFDLARDPFEALDALMALGADRVLTSGLAPTAPEGASLIADLVRRAAGRIGVLPGGGIRAGNAAALVAATGVTEIHVRAATMMESGMIARRQGIPMGRAYVPDEYRWEVTTAANIAEIVSAVA